MTPTEDEFRALSRSSPWLWRSLHFHFADHNQDVEAWVRRPGQLRVRREGQKDLEVDDRGLTRSGSRRVMYATTSRRWSLRGLGRGRRPRDLPPLRWPHEVAPVWRDDGLVTTRPSHHEVEYGDPMYENYYWVATLDPVELSHHTSFDDLREQERSGRRTWWARVRPEEGYEPRCGCCPLLWSPVSDRDEYAGGGDARLWTWQPPPGTVYPEAYQVALDVRTGVVVELVPVGDSSTPVGHRMEILADGAIA